MAKGATWEQAIGSRIRLRDLHILFAVAESGSMLRAADTLGISQPAVSAAIAELEHAIGARLLERGPRGATLTPFGEAIVARGRAAFDELRLGLQEVMSLRDATRGEVRVACSESIAAGIVVPILKRFAAVHSNVSVHVGWAPTDAHQFQELYDREVDLIIGRLTESSAHSRLHESLSITELYVDRFCVAAERGSSWAQAKTIDLEELAQAAWVTPPLHTVGASALMECFARNGIPVPEVKITTFSLHLREALAANANYLTALPESVVRLNPQFANLTVLPIELKMQPWTVGLVHLRDRTLISAVKAFADCAVSTVRECGFAIRPVPN
jgi:DNA-binding transcriptional LysR family regulator